MPFVRGPANFSDLETNCLSPSPANSLWQALDKTSTHKKFSRLARVSNNSNRLLIQLLLGQTRPRQALSDRFSSNSGRLSREEFPITHTRNDSILGETLFFSDLCDLPRCCNTHLIANHHRPHVQRAPEYRGEPDRIVHLIRKI